MRLFFVTSDSAHCCNFGVPVNVPDQRNQQNKESGDGGISGVGTNAFFLRATFFILQQVADSSEFRNMGISPGILFRRLMWFRL